MSKEKPNYIDAFDLTRIITKSSELAKIIKWLKRLVSIDKTIDKQEVEKIIHKLQAKKKLLDNKALKAQEVLIEEAEILASAYEVEDDE